MDVLSLSMRYWLQTFIEKADADKLDSETMNVQYLCRSAMVTVSGQESMGMSDAAAADELRITLGAGVRFLLGPSFSPQGRETTRCGCAMYA